MKITLIVSGSIAAYKSAELLREFVKRRWATHVVLTQSAQQFITPLTMQTLSGNLVTTEMFDRVRESEINHIRLADEADVVVVAPASANIIAKLANGICDDAATTVLLATRAKIVIAPAMNVNMWTNVATQENVSRLQERGVRFVEPETGSLACGWEGAGRLASPDQILFAVERASRPQDLVGKRFVVTAGPTREMIDPMRFISNRSSGKMGYALARQASLRGADVVLISGPSAETPPPGVVFKKITTASELLQTTRDALSEPAVGAKLSYLVMSAAVADHRPECASPVKLKQEKKAPYSLSLIPNDDIIARIASERADIEKKSLIPLRIIGFAAESGSGDAVPAIAAEKLAKKNLDLLIANAIETSVESDESEIWILKPKENPERFGVARKSEVADKILDFAGNL